MSSVKSTSVSMKTRPRIISVWMRAPAPGLRATPSAAAAATRDWPMAASAAAMAKPNPAAIFEYLATDSALSAATAPACASVGAADNSMPTTAKKAILSLLMDFSPVASGLDLMAATIRVLRGRARRVRFYEFAPTRYPPPLLQRRSSDVGTDRFRKAKADSSHATPALRPTARAKV